MAVTNATIAGLPRIKEACARAGVSVAQLDQAILERMALLAQYTPTFDDCQRTMDMADLVFAHLEAAGDSFSSLEKATVRIGSLFSDIGKTGPGRASTDQQRLVAEMFSVERVPDDTITVLEFFRLYFPADAPERCRCFASLDLDPSMPIRQFWNLHSAWTLDIMQTVAVPPEAVAAAATHHLLENVNPDSIVAADGTFTRRFGSNSAFDRPEKLVIVLDKYDAVRRRGRRDHASAISWLKALVLDNERFRADAQFNAMIDAVDAALSDKHTIFY